MPATFDDLPFIDLYVRLDAKDRPMYRSKERGQGRMNQFVPDEFLPVLERFAAAVPLAMHESFDGAIEFEGVRCRLSRQHMSDGTTWVCARRILRGCAAHH